MGIDDPAKEPRLRCGGKFIGPRVNCEEVPMLSVAIVAGVLRDPRKIPYLLVWRDRDDGKIVDAVRLAAYSEPPDRFGSDGTGWVEIKRPNNHHTRFRTIERLTPRNGGRKLLMICPSCQKPRRAFYGWELNRSRRQAALNSKWQCRQCAGLRYASEGGALVTRGRGFSAQFGPIHSDRPEVWHPYVFTNPADAQGLGVKMA